MRRKALNCQAVEEIPCVTSPLDYNRCAPTLSPKDPNSPAWRASHKGEWEHPKRKGHPQQVGRALFCPSALGAGGRQKHRLQLPPFQGRLHRLPHPGEIPHQRGGLPLGVVLPQTARTGTYSYWLLVRSARPEGLAERLERLAKLAPTESIDGIVAQALPGVRLRASAQPPAGLPQRTDTLYFTIDQNDPLWRKIMQQGNLALTFPSPPDDLAVVLAVIQR